MTMRLQRQRVETLLIGNRATWTADRY